jgi:dephospho-CoA kinase
MSASTHLPPHFLKSARVIGITGGIAMGKTTVSTYLENHHGLTILDADRYARDAVLPGGPILASLVDRYGPHILLPNGTLDRPALGSKIFTNPTERHWIESQIHPFVKEKLIQQRDRALQDHPDRPVILVIPLLFEAEMTELVTETWVIYCQRDDQLQRLMTRSGLTSAQALDRICSQLDIQVKCDRATWVLDNSSTVEDLYSQIDRALNLGATR